MPIDVDISFEDEDRYDEGEFGLIFNIKSEFNAKIFIRKPYMYPLSEWRKIAISVFTMKFEDIGSTFYLQNNGIYFNISSYSGEDIYSNEININIPIKDISQKLLDILEILDRKGYFDKEEDSKSENITSEMRAYLDEYKNLLEVNHYSYIPELFIHRATGFLIKQDDQYINYIVVAKDILNNNNIEKLTEKDIENAKNLGLTYDPNIHLNENKS